MANPLKFRILKLAACPLPLPRGSQVLIAGLAAALQSRGHAVEVVAYAAGAGTPELPFPVHRTPAWPFLRRQDPHPSLVKPLLDVLLAREALRCAHRRPPDVLHAHNLEGLVVGLWLRRRTGVPLVYHQHNLLEPELPTYFRFPPLRWAGRALGHWADQHLPRQADACIVLHDKAAAYLQRYGVDPRRVHVVPPGIDLPGPPADPATVRARYHLGDGPLVLYSGNLDHYQDLAFLREAFSLVHAARPAVQLLIATHRGGRGEPVLRARPGEAAIVVDGWSEMRQLLAAADVFVTPRQVCWGFPIKVLNYMAAGRPIVAAAGSAQGLRHMETAWVVDNGDAPAFARAILTLLQDHALASRLGQAARFDVEYRYTWPACASAVEAVYAQVTTSAVKLPPQAKFGFFQKSGGATLNEKIEPQ